MLVKKTFLLNCEKPKLLPQCQVNLRAWREHTRCMAVRVYVRNYEKKIYVMLCREYVCIIEGRELTEPDMTAEKMVKVNGSKHQ